jgi:hypothetical protein
MLPFCIAMASRFSHPPHPTELRDPHNIPNFSSQSKFDDAPVLYLPPLLSSLPDRYSVVEAPSNSSLPVMTETRLPDIDPTSLSLHKALHQFRPSSPDYANTAYEQAFNWSELRLPKGEEREWYCVVFRSRRKAGSDGICEYFSNAALNCMLMNIIALYDADKLAHEEAVRNGGVCPVFSSSNAYTY